MSTNSDSSIKMYVSVYLALMGLLVVTVAVAYVHLGIFNTAVAMAIGTVKACLVIWYFMHVKTTERLVPIFIGLSLYMLFIGALFTLSDYLTRVS
jgi:cytochrome c oxidase subunit IV